MSSAAPSPVPAAGLSPEERYFNRELSWLTFNERVMPKLSSATLTMTSMPGMANHVMKMTGVTSAVSKDGKSITLTSARPLSTGSYRVDWVIVGADTHRITGTHAFSVR